MNMENNGDDHFSFVGQNISSCSINMLKMYGLNLYLKTNIESDQYGYYF